MILVTGASGTLGTRLVARLVAEGKRVRILLRDPASIATSDEVEVVVGNAGDPSSLARAVAGVDAVVSAMTGFAGARGATPTAVDGDGNASLVRAARTAGVHRFLLISLRGAAQDHPVDVYRMKFRAEQALIESGLAWTIVRPTVYMETWAGIIGAPVLKKGSTRVFGSGRNPVNFISAGDVARFIAQLVDDASATGLALDVAGPENISLLQLVQRFETVAGRKASVQHVPVPMLRIASVLARPFNPTIARFAQAGLMMATADMAADASETRRRFPSVPLTTISDFVREEYA